MTALIVATLLTQTHPSLLVPESPSYVVVAEDPLAAGRTERLAASFAGALVGGTAVIAAMSGLAARRNPGDGTEAAFVVALAALPLGIGLGGYLGHVLAGGKATPLRGLMGGLAAMGLPAVLFLLGGDFSVNRTSRAKQAEAVAIGYGVAALPGILFTTWLLEYGHVRALEEMQVGFLPSKGGGTLSVGGAF